MNYLLDTHAIIWFINDSKSLPKISKSHIRNPKNKCFASIASFWEIGIKSSLGRLNLSKSLSDIFYIVEKSGIDLMPISLAHIEAQANLPWNHKDPFDRLIIAQAIVENLTLISKDEVFGAYDVDLFWDESSSKHPKL